MFTNLVHLFRANLAAACAGIIYFVLYIPYNMVYTFNSKMSFAQKIIAVRQLVYCWLVFLSVCCLFAFKLCSSLTDAACRKITCARKPDF